MQGTTKKGSQWVQKEAWRETNGGRDGKNFMLQGLNSRGGPQSVQKSTGDSQERRGRIRPLPVFLIRVAVVRRGSLGKADSNHTVKAEWLVGTDNTLTPSNREKSYHATAAWWSA